MSASLLDALATDTDSILIARSVVSAATLTVTLLLLPRLGR